MIYLGKIEVASGAAKNNRNTATPFVIPTTQSRIFVTTDTADVVFAIGAGDDFEATADDAPIPQDGVLFGPYSTAGIAAELPTEGGSTVPAGVNDGPAWEAGVPYAAGALVSSDSGKLYRCITAGTSDLYGSGPAGTDSDITDGTVHWAFAGAKQAGEAVTPADKPSTVVSVRNDTGGPAVVKVYAGG